MEGMRRTREWKEALPQGRSSESAHEFSTLVSNIYKEFGATDVIDFGCGDGTLCKSFSKGSYLGLDIDEKILDVASSSFPDYSFQKPNAEAYSTDMCIASRVFNELKEDDINGILKKMRCKWFVLAEPLQQKEVKGNIYPFYTRNREKYVSLMRAHDLLLVKHMVKSVEGNSPQDVSLLVFRKCGRNPNIY